MRNDFIHRLIRNLSIVVLLGGFGAVMLPSPDAFARTVISPDQCINSLKKLELWPPPDAVTARVRAYCAKGDLQGAVNVIQAERIGQCVNSLKRLGLWPPPREVYEKVRAYCARGDLRGAVTVIREARKEPEPRVMSAEQCVNSLKKLGLWPPPKEVYEKVRAYCARGDLKRAVTVIREAGREPEPDVIQEPGREPEPDVIQEAESKSTFLMPVEEVFSITGRGTVAVGRIQRGKVKVGDRIEIVGFKGTRETYVTGIEMFRREVNEAVAGDSVGLLLRGIPKTDIEPGMVLAQPPGSIKLHQSFEAEVYVLPEKEGGSPFPLSLRSRHQFYMWTTDVAGIIKAATEMIMPGDRIDVTVNLIHPIAIEPGMRFAIRKDGQTVGAGVVLKILR